MPQIGARATRDIWWLLLLILIGQTALMGYNILRDAKNDAAVQRSLTILNDLYRLQAHVVDSETGARGFVITGAEPFLEPFNESLVATPRVIERLTREFAPDLDQLVQLQEFTRRVNQRQRLLADLIAIRRREPYDAARATEMVSRGKQEMDEIRASVDAMLGHEKQVLDKRNKTADQTTSAAIFGTLLGGFLAIASLALANYLIRREHRARRQSEELARESEARFKLIAESLPQLVWVARGNGEHEYFNRRWYEYTGQTADQSLGFGWSEVLHPDDRQSSRARWHDSAEMGVPYELEYRVRRHDGVYRWFLGRATPLRDADGTIVRWFGTCTDIDDQKRAKEDLEQRVVERTTELQQVVTDLNAEVHDRKRATQQLQQTATELERSNRELEQFAYVASHDLQEPLRKIQTFGDRLKVISAMQLDEQARDYVERMQSSASRMRKLIDDLLTFSRVSTRPTAFSEVDLNEVVQEVLGDLDDAVVRSNGRVDVAVLPKIIADRLQMQQMMQNLISNGLKFHKPDLPPVVRIMGESLVRMPSDPPTQTDRPAIRIEVADNGIGFDPTYRERIFQLFQRLHGRNEYEGTGIGLALVRRIVERHGGVIAAHGSPGAGARFTVFLPSCCLDPRAIEPDSQILAKK